jgi:hypothetical protein
MFSVRINVWGHLLDSRVDGAVQTQGMREVLLVFQVRRQTAQATVLPEALQVRMIFGDGSLAQELENSLKSKNGQMNMGTTKLVE